jgi:uncharacterized protein YndB with AHSA1/START domain
MSSKWTSCRAREPMLIDRAPAEVFRFLSEPEHLVDWRSGVQSARRTTDGPMGVGATFEQIVLHDGRTEVQPSEVLAYEPTYQFAWLTQLDGAVLVTRVTLEAVDGRTLVRLRRQLVAPSIGNPMPADEVQSDLLRLRAAIEASS